MHQTVPILVVLTCLGFLHSVATAAETSGRRPNILWISAEDICPDLGCYGDTYAHTPNLDKFAASGLRFDKAFSAAPVCSPSRSSIITGMYASSIGTMHHRSDGVPPEYVKCFPEYLRAAGYFCTNNAKTDYNFPVPASAWDECGHDAHWKHRKDGQPFFAVFNTNISHESRMLMNDKQFEHEVAGVKPQDRHDPAKATLPPYYPDTPVVRKDWAHYYDAVTAMDLQFAEWLKELDDAGLTENTIVFFWGDHGRGLPRGKRWLWDSGIRVPLLVRWPGKIEPGSVRSDLVSLMDLAPTMLSLAGVKPPEYMQAQIFLGPDAAPPRQYIFCHRDRMDETPDTIRCVRDEKFKYIRNFHPELPYAQHIKYMDRIPLMQEWRRLNAEGKLTGPAKLFFAPTKPKEELYDLSVDPDELKNLADDPAYAHDLCPLREALDKWMEQTHDQGLIPEAELQAKMRPGGKTPETKPPKIEIEEKDGESLVKLSSETPGASIVWTAEIGPSARWTLYSKPFPLKGSTTVSAIAARTGFENSQKVEEKVPAK